MIIRSKTLNWEPYVYINGSTSISGKDNRIISYDSQNNTIYFRFKDYESFIQAKGTHQVFITLYDVSGKEKLYTFDVVFFEKKLFI